MCCGSVMLCGKACPPSWEKNVKSSIKQDQKVNTRRKNSKEDNEIQACRSDQKKKGATMFQADRPGERRG